MQISFPSTAALLMALAALGCSSQRQMSAWTDDQTLVGGWAFEDGMIESGYDASGMYLLNNGTGLIIVSSFHLPMTWTAHNGTLTIRYTHYEEGIDAVENIPYSISDDGKTLTSPQQIMEFDTDELRRADLPLVIRKD